MPTVDLVERAFAASACVALGVSCSKAPLPTGDPLGTITIGVVESLTGDQGQVGGPMKTATEVAEWQLNSLGGILGKHVAYQIQDDATQSPQTQAIAKQFIQDGVAAVLGSTSSNQVGAVDQLFYAARFIQISSTATSPTLALAEPFHDRYLFLTIATSDRMAPVLSKFAAEGSAALLDAGSGGAGATPCKNLQIVNAGDSFGQPFADAVSADFQRRGGNVLKPIVVPTSQQADYSAQVAALIGATPQADCAALLMFAPAAAQFMISFRKVTATDTSRNWGAFTILASNSEYSTAFVTGSLSNPANPSSGSAAEGVYGVYVDPTPETNQYEQFANLYAAMFQVPLDQPVLLRSTANQYDAAILEALAIQAAGGTSDRVALRDALYDVSRGTQHGKPVSAHAYGPAELGDALAALRRGDPIKYNGASGPVVFDDCGNVTEDFIVWKVVGGQFQTLERIAAASVPSPPCVAGGNDGGVDQ